jgi:hypothetical protein
VGAGMAEADADLQREREWINLNRVSYWKEETRKRTELLAKAKIALVGKKFQTTPLGGRPSCVEEEKALARATRRVEEAEQKTANVQVWRRRFDEEFFSYQGATSGLSQALSGDIPMALARLDKMLDALEAYAASKAPELQGSVAAGERAGLGNELGSMARAAPSGLQEAGDYRRLREQTPSASTRDAIPTAKISDDWRSAAVPEPEWPLKLERLGMPRAPVADEDKVVLSRGAAGQSRIYLERLAEVSRGDSGWYIGNVDDTATPVYDAVCVADMVAARPDIAPLLDLPAGHLIVLNGSELEAVFDARHQRLWPAGEGGTP